MKWCGGDKFVSDRVCSSTDGIQKLYNKKLYSRNLLGQNKYMPAIVSGTYVYGSFWLSFDAA